MGSKYFGIEFNWKDQLELPFWDFLNFKFEYWIFPYIKSHDYNYCFILIDEFQIVIFVRLSLLLRLYQIVHFLLLIGGCTKRPDLAIERLRFQIYIHVVFPKVLVVKAFFWDD